MPSVLCIVLKRFGHDGYGATKSLANITWDLNDLDMAPYFLHPSDCEYDGYIEDKAFTAPFRYECYAVVEHTGGSAQSGHYTAFVRDPRTHDPSAWLYCNDAYVDKVRMDNPNEKRRLFKDGNRVPYIAFFRRKGGS
jgi:ubiquitin carboxyl-terminal hydrolase 8